MKILEWLELYLGYTLIVLAILTCLIVSVVLVKDGCYNTSGNSKEPKEWRKTEERWAKKGFYVATREKYKKRSLLYG